MLNRLLTMTPTQMVETIWEGNVKKFSRAYELICIVDQIQDYAVNHHRPFVMKHLEAWHARHQKTLEPVKEAVPVVHEDTDISGFDSDDINNDSYDFDKDLEMGDFGSDDKDSPHDFNELAKLFRPSPNKPAEWLRLKEQSKNARQEMASETRKRNRSLLKIGQAPKSANEPQMTRPRGRPRKAGVIEKEAPKRGRGRPPKMANKIIKESQKTQPRGRPRKAGVIKKEAPKRGRGRPPKMANKIIKMGLEKLKPLL